MDSVSRTRSGRSFSSFDVFESSVDISTSLQQAFVGLSDVDSKDHDDSEGCPLDILDSDAPNYSVPLSPPVSTIFQRPTTSNLDEGAKHPSTRTASQQEYRRKKKQHTRQRKRLLQEKQPYPSPKPLVRPSVVDKLTSPIRITADAAGFRAAKGGWVGTRGEVGEGAKKIQSLLDAQYRYVAWDGM